MIFRKLSENDLEKKVIRSYINESQNDLTEEGYKLILHYYQNKSSIEKTDADFVPLMFFSPNYKTLLSIISLFIKSKNTSLLIIHQNINHKQAYKLEKNNKSINIILIDSVGKNNNTDFNKFILSLAQDIRKIIPIFISLSIGTNISNQQTDQTSCGFFALKNLRKLSQSTNFYQELQDKKLIENRKEINKKDSVFHFHLPARFMIYAQSPDKLTEYITQHPQQKICLFYQKKSPTKENLQKKISRKRIGPTGIITPITINDRNTDQQIIKNNLIKYFCDKYLYYAENCRIDEDQRERISQYYDARHLTLNRQGYLSYRSLSTELVRHFSCCAIL